MLQKMFPNCSFRLFLRRFSVFSSLAALLSSEGFKPGGVFPREMVGSLEEKRGVCYTSFLVAVSWFSASPLSTFSFFFFLPIFYAAGLQPALARSGAGGRINAGFARRAAEPCGSRRESRAGVRRGSPERDRGGRRGKRCLRTAAGGGAGRPAVPGGASRESGRPCPAMSPAGRRGPALAGGGAAAALPPRPGPSLPRLGRGNDLRGNRGRSGGDRDAPAMLRRPEDPAGAAGRSVGLCPAPPALPGDTAGGRGRLLFPGSAAPSVPGGLWLVPPAGRGSGGGSVGFRGAPVAEEPRAGGGSAGMGRGSRAAGGAPRAGAQEETRCSSPAPCDGRSVSSPSCLV